jgi:ATP-dependent DNA helicase PIF1
MSTGIFALFLLFLLMAIIAIGDGIVFWNQNQKLKQLQKEVKHLHQKERSASSEQKVLANKPEKESPSSTALLPTQRQRYISESSNIEISGEFENALSLLENTSDCVFITGKAGTGKSTLLKYFVANTKKQVIVLAFTGVAALNIGGETIHSFFKFPPRPIMDDDIKERSNREIYRLIDTIVIDEISMVRADLLDAIDKFMRINGRDISKPFGGIQVAFFGDLYQLSPIVSGAEESQFIASLYKTSWFFDANVLKSHPYKLFELTKVYRQKDSTFIALLDSIRTGYFDNSHLNQLNRRFQAKQLQNGITPNITLTSTNSLAAQINKAKLNQLVSPEFTYLGTLEGDFPKKALPTDTVLKFKQDAQVMFVKNDFQRKWVNGTIGKIHSLDKDSIHVEITENGTQSIYPVSIEKWEIPKYKFDPIAHRLETEIVGSFTQYPLRLAWAVTIHKSQGLSFDNILIDLGNGAFAHGQTYVALSRCTSYEGISLKKRISRSDVRVDSEVNRYFSNVGTLQ